MRFMASSRWPAPLCKSNIPGGGIGKLNLLLRTSIVLERLHLQGRGAGDGESYCAYCCVTVIQVACRDITKRRKKKKKTVERQTFENGARKNQNKDGGCGRLASSARRKKKKAKAESSFEEFIFVCAVAVAEVPGRPSASVGKTLASRRRKFDEGTVQHGRVVCPHHSRSRLRACYPFASLQSVSIPVTRPVRAVGSAGSPPTGYRALIPVAQARPVM